MGLSWEDWVGYVGMALALGSMSMRTIIPLRLFAMGACCRASGSHLAVRAANDCFSLGDAGAQW
jgi:hypothetical protein